MKSSFPKHDRRIWHWHYNIDFWICAYIYIYIYIHISEELFSKTWSPNLAIVLQHRLLDWRLARFGKELLISFNVKSLMNHRPEGIQSGEARKATPTGDLTVSQHSDTHSRHNIQSH